MAAGTGAIRAGKAFVELFADDSKLVAALRRASAKLKAWGTAVREVGMTLAKLGAIAAVPLLMSARSFARMGDEVAKMSRRTGFSVESLSELAVAAELSGADVETLEKGIARMQRTLKDAAAGMSSAQQALAMLGLTAKDLDGLSPERQFKLIADRLAKVEDPTVKAALAMELFGRSGARLIPMLAGGAAGIEQLQKQAREMGLTISADDAHAAEDLTDAMTLLWKILRQGVFVIGSALAPCLKDLTKWITGAVISVVKWLRRNRELMLTIFKVSAAVVAGGVALIGLGYAISGLGSIFGALATAVSVVGSVMGVLGAVLAWMLSPIGLVIAAAAALGGYLIYASGAGGKALDWLSGKFSELKDDACLAYKGIGDALAAGDIGLAAKILWLTLKMEWQKGVNWISEVWNDGLLWFEKRAIEAFYGLGMAVGTIWHGLEVGWIEFTAGLSEIWTMLCTAIQAGWNWTAKSLQQTWNWLKGMFDETFDASAANAVIERNYQEANKKLEGEMLNEINNREEQRTQERAKSKAEYDAQMKTAITEAEKAKGNLDKEFAKKKTDNQKELDQAKKEWQDAIKEAGDNRKAREAGGPGAMQGPEDIIKNARKQLMGLGDVMDMAGKHTIGVKGTFNAMEARGLAAGGVTDRIANATERTAENTRKLLDKAGDGLTFE